MPRGELGRLVEESIKHLQTAYRSDKKGFLTEGDVASTLFWMLKSQLKNETNVAVHSQLQPYKKRNNQVYIIGKDEGWEKPKGGHWGAVVDVAAIDTSESFWNDAYERVKHRKYWRVSGHPVEAFLAIIEIKIRVHGNIKRIKKDIDKLLAIREENPRCLLYLVIMDRKANPKDIWEIKKYVGGKPMRLAITESMTLL